MRRRSYPLIGQLSFDMGTFSTSVLPSSSPWDPSTSSVPGGPASLTPSRASGRARKIPGTSGEKSSACCAWLGPDGSWERTSASYSRRKAAGSSEDASGTWIVSGTMSGGRCYPLVPLVRLTKGVGFSLLPTPRVQDHKHSAPTSWELSRPYGMDHLAVRLARLLPQEAGGLGGPTPNVLRYIPTPTTSMKHGAGHRPDKEGMANLQTWVLRATGLQLNPPFVEWMQGLPVGHITSICLATASSPSKRTRSRKPSTTNGGA